MTTTESPVRYRLTILTKPFIDSDRLSLIEDAGFIRMDRLHLHITKNGRGHYCVPRETIREMEVEVVR